jgi:hypothetical protein
MRHERGPLSRMTAPCPLTAAPGLPNIAGTWE